MIYICLYLIPIVLANYVLGIFRTTEFALYISYFNAFAFIGFDLVFRDKLHDAWKNKNLAINMLLLILLGGYISYLVNKEAGIIAIASTASFILSGLADAFAYQLNIKKSFIVRSSRSNAIGAVVDSIVFPLIAFGFNPLTMVFQFLSKYFGGLIWLYVITKFRRTS